MRARKHVVALDAHAVRDALLRNAFEAEGVDTGTAAEATRLLLDRSPGLFFARWSLALQMTGLPPDTLAKALLRAGVTS